MGACYPLAFSFLFSPWVQPIERWRLHLKKVCMPLLTSSRKSLPEHVNACQVDNQAKPTQPKWSEAVSKNHGGNSTPPSINTPWTWPLVLRTWLVLNPLAQTIFLFGPWPKDAVGTLIAVLTNKRCLGVSLLPCLCFRWGPPSNSCLFPDIRAI